jgi:YD repeat-containing protein
VGIGDFIPDPIEHAVEKGTEWVGDRVEDAGDWTADRLDDLGWDSGADWVREQSRSVANRMGAQVDEMDLGQTDDKTKLIYGSPGKLRSTAGHLHTFQRSFDDVGDGLKGLNSDHLKGEAAEAFRKSVHIQPPKWFTEAEAPAHRSPGTRDFAGLMLRRAGRTSYAYDGQGRLIRRTRKLLNGKRETWTYVWNAEDRLTEVTTPDEDRWRYRYDPMGRRISKQRLTEDDGVV